MPPITSSEILMLLSEMAGVILLLGTMALVGFRRIYFDSETKQATEIEIPILGKFKTQAPALVLIVVGAFLVAYPITQDHPDMATIHGIVNTGGHTMTAVVVGTPVYETTMQSSGPYSFKIPLLKNVDYRVQFIVDQQIFTDQAAIISKGDAPMKPVEYQPGRDVGAETVPAIQPQKEVPDEVLQKMGITPLISLVSVEGAIYAQQPGKLHGTVTVAGVPSQGTTVSAYRETQGRTSYSANIVTRTARDGSYSLVVSPGTYILILTIDGRAAYQGEVAVGAGASVDKSIQLQRRSGRN